MLTDLKVLMDPISGKDCLASLIDLLGEYFVILPAFAYFVGNFHPCFFHALTNSVFFHFAFAISHFVAQPVWGAMFRALLMPCDVVTT